MGRWAKVVDSTAPPAPTPAPFGSFQVGIRHSPFGHYLMTPGEASCWGVGGSIHVNWGAYPFPGLCRLPWPPIPLSFPGPEPVSSSDALVQCSINPGPPSTAWSCCRCSFALHHPAPSVTPPMPGGFFMWIRARMSNLHSSAHPPLSYLFRSPDVSPVHVPTHRAQQVGGASQGGLGQ